MKYHKNLYNGKTFDDGRKKDHPSIPLKVTHEQGEQTLAAMAQVTFYAADRANCEPSSTWIQIMNFEGENIAAPEEITNEELAAIVLGASNWREAVKRHAQDVVECFPMEWLDGYGDMS